MTAAAPTADTLPGLYPKPDPPAVTAGSVPAALQGVFAERNQRHQRVAGARLTIAARWVHDPRFPQHLWIDWAIDYDGPRRPFAILNPQRARGDNPGFVHCWAMKPDGTVAAMSWAVAGGWGCSIPPDKQRDEFTVSADGKPVVGGLYAGGTGTLNGPLGRDTGPGDPPLWVQFEYAPTDRGDGYDKLWDPVTRTASRGPDWTFDAWTGKLWSPVVAVATK